METIRIDVTKNIATCMNEATIVCDNDDYQIEFILDEEWSAYPNRTARFIWNGKYYDVPFTGNTCKMPPVCGAEYCIVGVYSEGVHTTTDAKIRCRPSVLDMASEPTDGYNQHNISEAKQAADEAKQAAVDAAESAENAAAHVAEAKDHATAAAASAGAAATAATDAVKVYRKSMANALIGNASGEVVTLDDVSPIDHEMNVRVRSKNLLQIPASISPSCATGLTMTKDNGVITLSGTYSAAMLADYKLTDKLHLPAGTYTISGCPESDGITQCRIMVEVMQNNGKFGYYSDYGKSKYFVLAEGEYINQITIRVDPTWVSGTTKVFMPQLEEDSTATVHAPFVDVTGVNVLQGMPDDENPIQYKPNAEGVVEGVASVYPCTNLYSDTAGVLLDVTYNRDLNKAFLELQQAILSLGV